MEFSRIGGQGVRAVMGLAAITVVVIVVCTWPNDSPSGAARARGAGLIPAKTASPPVPAQASAAVKPLEAAMNMEAVKALLGEPSSQATSGNGNAGFALWRYPDGRVLRFQDGALVSWEDGQSVSRSSLPAEASPEDQRIAAAYWILEQLAETGIARKIEIGKYAVTVWVDPLLWAMLDRDKKESLIYMCAGCSEAIHEFGDCRIRSYSNDEVLGELGWFGGAKIRR